VFPEDPQKAASGIGCVREAVTSRSGRRELAAEALPRAYPAINIIIGTVVIWNWQHVRVALPLLLLLLLHGSGLA
jgi:hypothetical protein